MGNSIDITSFTSIALKKVEKDTDMLPFNLSILVPLLFFAAHLLT
jgi:hypothetical protein